MEIICHIGQTKTASTSIQANLDRGRKFLAAAGMLYPKSLGQPKSSMVPSFAFQESHPKLSNVCNRVRDALEKEMSSGFNKVLISEERLFGLGIARQMKENFGVYAKSWRILCYLRRPDEHIVSAYNEEVKAGYVHSFDEFFKNRLRNKHYCFAARMERWVDVFGQDSVQVRVFHSNAQQGTIWEDFAQWIDIDGSQLAIGNDARINRSLDQVSVEILRFLNGCTLNRPDLLKKFNLLGSDGRRDATALIAHLQMLDTGECLQLDSVRAKLLLDEVREDHERLAERYLSPEHAMILLAPPPSNRFCPPLDEKALFDRMVKIFDHPALAHLALKHWHLKA
jgi:hypothetical protein